MPAWVQAQGLASYMPLDVAIYGYIVTLFGGTLIDITITFGGTAIHVTVFIIAINLSSFCSHEYARHFSH